jgi:thioredoxin-related protein
MFKPGYEELAKKKSENVFYEMDISITETWRKFDVMSIPTVIIFKNGKIHSRFTAMLRTEDISRALLNFER